MKRPRLAAIAALLACSLLAINACSDDEVGGGSPFDDATINTGGVPQGGGLPQVGDPDVEVGTPGDNPRGNKPDPGTPDEDTTEPPIPTFDQLEIIFLHDTSTPLALHVNEDRTVMVKVIDYGTGGAAENVLLNWNIIEASGAGAPGDAELSADATFTDQNGLAQITFRANTASDILYTLEVTADNADPVTTLVGVGNFPTGALRITLNYQGGVDINTIAVRLMPGSFLCGAFKPTSVPNNPLAEKTVINTNAKPQFDGVEGGKTYTVVATAKGPLANLAAAGCRDGIYVPVGETAEATLDLFMLVLNPAGTYDLDNIFDFTGAIPGQLGQIVDTLSDLFYDPGKFLINQIKNLVKQYLGGLITDAVFGLFGDALGDMITDWVLNDAPEWVQDIFTVGQDLLQIVKRLELTGILKISKLSSDFYVQGITTYTGVILTWKLGCDKNAPDYEECGKMPFTMDQFNNNGDFPMDLLSGAWTGNIVSFDTLSVAPHELALNYGKLILFVLQKVILKYLTGEDTLVDAAVAIIGCDGIAKSLDNWVDYDDTYKACKSTVTLLVAPVQSYLESLATPSFATLQGSAKMVDEDDDLIVDRLTDGKWSGQILIQNATSSNFSGTWEAVRKAQP